MKPGEIRLYSKLGRYEYGNDPTIAQTKHRVRGAAMDDSAHERVYDAVPFDELEYDEDEELYTYQCPCGDLFEISQAELDAGERIAKCPSCSLRLRVVLPGEEHDDTQPEAMSAAQKEAAAEEALEEAEFAALDKKLESKISKLKIWSFIKFKIVNRLIVNTSLNATFI